MISFKQFLSEKRSPTRPALWGVEAETALKAIKTNCSKAIKEAQEGRLLYRGVVKLDESFRGGDSKEVDRYRGTLPHGSHSHWMRNFLPSWQKYPKRDNAYICSTDYNEAKAYAGGSGHVFVVFPHDTAHLGICPSHDMKHSFDHLKLSGFTDLVSFNFAIGTMLQAAAGKGNVAKDPEQLQAQLKSITPQVIKKIIDEKAVDATTARIIKRFNTMMNWYSNLFDALNDFMDPEMNGFETHLMGDLPSDNREVWVVGKLVAKEIGVDDQQLKMLSDRLKIDHTLFHV